MNALRKASLVVAFAAVLAVGVFQSSAEAGGCHGLGYYHMKYPSYNFGLYNSGLYNNCYSGSCYRPTYRVIRPISYPVTYYDCYGRPYIVWRTSYSNYTNPLW